MTYLIGVIVVVLVAVGFALMNQDQAPTATKPEAETSVLTTEDPTVTNDSNTDETITPVATTIADDTHSTIVTYFTPANNEYKLDVSLTTESGVITDATIVYSQGAEKDPNAQRFEEAYKAEVIGKKINELDLSRVGGASLTTAAFNEAVDNILAGDA